VATAAVLLADPPESFSVLSAHKYIPPVMEIVAEMPETRVEGFLAAGHAATITGWGVFEPFVARHGLPVVVAGFEPLDILAGLVKLLELVRDRRAAAPRRVRALRCAAAVRRRSERAVVARAAVAHRAVHLRRHHGRALGAGAVRVVREGVRARAAGRRLYGLERRHLQDLAPLRRASGSGRRRMNIGERITMKYGAGGRAMRSLIASVFVDGLADGRTEEPGFVGLEAMDDGAAIPIGGGRFLVLTCDSHVVKPIFFPGGDLGRMSSTDASTSGANRAHGGTPA
jgi:hypothetical protein